MKILTLGEKIKFKRKELGLTLKDLAGDRISSGQISLIESGKSNPSMDLLGYLSEVLATPINYFMETETVQVNKYCGYKENLFFYFLQSNNIEKCQEIYNELYEIGSKYKINWIKASSYFMKAEVDYKLNNYNQSISNYLKAKTFYTKCNDPLKICYCFYRTGEINFKLMNNAVANSYFKRVESLLNEVGEVDPSFTGMVYYYIFITYYYMGNLNHCEKYAELTNSKFENVFNKREYVKYLYELSLANEDLDMDLSIKYSKHAKDLLNEYESFFDISFAKNSLGDYYLETSNFDSSNKQYNDSLNLLKMTNSYNYLESLFKLANLFLSSNNKPMFNDTLAVLKKEIRADDYQNLSNLYIMLFNANKNAVDKTDCEDYLEQSLKYALKSDNQERIIHCYAEYLKYHSNKDVLDNSDFDSTKKEYMDNLEMYLQDAVSYFSNKGKDDN